MKCVSTYWIWLKFTVLYFTPLSALFLGCRVRTGWLRGMQLGSDSPDGLFFWRVKTKRSGVVAPLENEQVGLCGERQHRVQVVTPKIQPWIINQIQKHLPDGTVTEPTEEIGQWVMQRRQCNLLCMPAHKWEQLWSRLDANFKWSSIIRSPSDISLLLDFSCTPHSKATTKVFIGVENFRH